MKSNRVLIYLLIVISLIVSACGTVLDEGQEQTENQEETEQVQEKEPEQVETEEQPETEPEKEEVTETESVPNENKVTPIEPLELIPVTLVRTIDGDTIKIKYEGKEVNVRYLLIDTPETNHPRLGKQPFGDNAKDRNRELVNSGELAIEFDIGEKYDKYGRLLAYVYVDGVSVQQKLLEEGLARVAYVYPPNTRHLTPFEETQKIAQQKRVGIWSIEDYATSSGFDENAYNESEKSADQNKPAEAPKTQPKDSDFKNCTELRTVYPNGVPEGHPAYQQKMDRDRDGFACER